MVIPVLLYIFKFTLSKDLLISCNNCIFHEGWKLFSFDRIIIALMDYFVLLVLLICQVLVDLILLHQNIKLLIHFGYGRVGGLNILFVGLRFSLQGIFLTLESHRPANITLNKSPNVTRLAAASIAIQSQVVHVFERDPLIRAKGRDDSLI